MRADAPPVEFSIELTPEAFVRWRIGRDGTIQPPPVVGDRVPLSYLVFLRAQPVLGVDFRELLGRDPDRGLYGGVAYRLLRPLRIGQRLQATSAVTSRREVDSPRGRLAITTLLTTWRCEGEDHATEEVRMIDLPPTPHEPAPAQDVKPHQPVHPRLATVPPIVRSQVAWLTTETGDTNALHLDAQYAASRHYPDVVVPATLITALLQREIEQAGRGTLDSLDVRYLAPTYPGDELVIHARRDDREFTFEAVAGGTLRAQGRCRVEA
jgi:acyl dehydratase